jgi:hypothetical protein
MTPSDGTSNPALMPSQGRLALPMRARADDLVLRGLDTDGRPLILELPADGDFVQEMLDKLAGGIDVIRQSRATDTTRLQLSNGAVTTLKLYHPAARVVHVALFELLCDDGLFRPPLDPRRYVEGCIVVRRTTLAGQRRWGRDAVGVQSWAQMPGDADAAYPDPSKQLAAIRTGDPDLDRELAVSAPVFDEARVPMFLAPPEVCDALGRTVVYAVVQTSSGDMSAAPPPFADANTLRSHVPAYLRSTNGTQRVPFAGQNVSYGTLTSATSNPSAGDNGLFLAFVLMLRQLVFEFKLFEPAPAAAAQRIVAALDKLNVKYKVGNTEAFQPASTFLRGAANLLVLRTTTTSLLMPVEWPVINAATGNAIQSAVAEIVNAAIQSIQPQDGRFNNPRNRYVLRGYARIEEARDCPPATISSVDSAVFSIAPWYEGKAPPVPIVLPDMNMNALKQLKPNVAFAVPKEMQGLLELNDAKDLAEGNGKNSNVQLAIDWICSFSLPVITICAFIVLNIFLQLFNIVFQWLFWLKICIPFPRPTVTEE